MQQFGGYVTREQFLAGLEQKLDIEDYNQEMEKMRETQFWFENIRETEKNGK